MPWREHVLDHSRTSWRYGQRPRKSQTGGRPAPGGGQTSGRVQSRPSYPPNMAQRPQPGKNGLHLPAGSGRLSDHEMDVEVVSSLLKSVGMQAGLPGPASGLLGQLGIPITVDIDA